MERGSAAGQAPSHPELQRAIASVPGVVEASIGLASDTDRSRLRIRLAPGEDAEVVSWAVAATLRERFGIALDPDDIRPQGPEVVDDDDPVRVATDPEPLPREPDDRALTIGTGTSVSRRVVIRGLQTRKEADEVDVIATLGLFGHEVAGRARGVATQRGTLRAVAEATVAGLGELTETRLRAVVDRVSHVASVEPSTVTVVLGVVDSRGGEDTLLGAALVRGDLERAVMRATLDALNRRIAPSLAGFEAVVDAGGE